MIKVFPRFKLCLHGIDVYIERNEDSEYNKNKVDSSDFGIAIAEGEVYKVNGYDICNGSFTLTINEAKELVKELMYAIEESESYERIEKEYFEKDKKK